MNYSSLTKVMLVILVAGLCFAVFDAVAGPCYKNTSYQTCPGGTNGCSTLNSGSPAPCGGGPWSIATMAAHGYDTNCRVSIWDYNTPKPNQTSGNESTGYQSQGNFSWVCHGIKTCTFTTTWLPLPVVYNCVVNPITPCNSISVWSAGGGACSAGG